MSRVQKLDVCIKKLFKNYGCKLFKQYLDAKLELFVNGKLTAGEIAVLATNVYARRGSVYQIDKKI